MSVRLLGGWQKKLSVLLSVGSCDGLSLVGSVLYCRLFYKTKQFFPHQSFRLKLFLHCEPPASGAMRLRRGGRSAILSMLGLFISILLPTLFQF